MNSITRRTLLSSLVSGACAASLPLTAFGKVKPVGRLVQLNANENPYGPSARALTAARQASARGAYYSMDVQRTLLDAIAAGEGLERDNVVISTGSNEALCAAMAAWGKTGHILAPALTYSAHLGYARRTGVEVRSVPLAADLSIDLKAMAAAVTPDTSMVYLCNPNNPTGLPLNTEALLEFCQKVGQHATVLVDEAYNELMADPAIASMVKLVRSEANVIVARTFSKIYGLAGMRVGYAMGRADLIKKLSAHVMSWNSHVGIAAALASYQDEAFIAQSRKQIVAGRKIVEDTYARHGVTFLPSSTNFIYANILRDATNFSQAMKDQGVLISRSYPGYPNWSRVSMGKIEDLKVFSKVFDEVYVKPET